MKTTKSIKNSEFQIVLDSIRKITKSARISSRDSEKTVGLSTAQIFVLQKLDQNSVMTVNELARATFTHQSSVSVVISKLVDRRLVERVESKADARSFDLRITSQGSYLLSKCKPSIQDRLFEGFKKLSLADQKSLAFGMQKLVEKSGLKEEKAPMLMEDSDE